MSRSLLHRKNEGSHPSPLHETLLGEVHATYCTWHQSTAPYDVPLTLAQKDEGSHPSPLHETLLGEVHSTYCTWHQTGKIATFTHISNRLQAVLMPQVKGEWVLSMSQFRPKGSIISHSPLLNIFLMAIAAEPPGRQRASASGQINKNQKWLSSDPAFATDVCTPNCSHTAPGSTLASLTQDPMAAQA